MYQRWDYLLISAFYSDMPVPSWSMRIGPHSRLESWGEIVAYVSELGEEGWELVSTSSLNYPRGGIEYAFAFKRPKD